MSARDDLLAEERDRRYQELLASPTACVKHGVMCRGECGYSRRRISHDEARRISREQITDDHADGGDA